MEGWIKVYRALLDKPIWKRSTKEQKVILVAMLLMANHKTKKWEWDGKQFECAPGQFVTSLDEIVKNCGNGKDITIQNVRTAIKRFEKLDFLTNESTKTGRLITIVNWRIYQSTEDEPNKDTNKDLTDNQQRTNKDLTPNKNVKNDKNERMKEGKDSMSSGTSAEHDSKYPYKEIIDYLNQKSDSSYRFQSKDTQKHIRARINEGFVFGDFVKVIDTKVSEWNKEPEKGKKDMRPYIRPSTLFGTKFESYLNQGAVIQPVSKRNEWEEFMNEYQ